jgi:REP element-mobilizing transposase RayT
VPRRPRVFVDGAIYHVYCRTARGERVFSDPSEASCFLEIVRDVKERDGFVVLAWCVMPTHYHLVLRTAHVPLRRSMRLIQGRFAQGHNRRHRVLGSLWQERYKAKLVNEHAYLATVMAYVHLNPVAARLVDDPRDYALCGHRELLGRGRGGLVDVDETLALLGDTITMARRAYRTVVAALRGRDLGTREPGRLPWWGPEVASKSAIATTAGPRIDATGMSTGRDRPHLSAESFLGRACSALGIDTNRLASPRRDRETARARDLVCLLGVERWGVLTRELAAALGKSADQVSLWTGRGSARKRTDTAFLRAIDDLDATLSSGAGDGTP